MARLTFLVSRAVKRAKPFRRLCVHRFTPGALPREWSGLRKIRSLVYSGVRVQVSAADYNRRRLNRNNCAATGGGPLRSILLLIKPPRRSVRNDNGFNSASPSFVVGAKSFGIRGTISIPVCYNAYAFRYSLVPQRRRTSKSMENSSVFFFFLIPEESFYLRFFTRRTQNNV